VTERRYQLLTRLGFRYGLNGPHAARTMMLDDLRVLLARTQLNASRADYVIAIVENNVLGKPTRKSRELALRHMTRLYDLDPANPIFRFMRHLWALDEAAQPMLALAVALAPDPHLRSTQEFVLGLSPGTPVTRDAVEAFLGSTYPDRFSPASLKSFSQNVAGTWTAAGHLLGHVRKSRALPEAHPESAAMLLFLGFLEGRSGQRLFTSEWVSLLCVSAEEFESLASSASHRGLLVFMNAGGVKEVRFPGYVTPEEEQIRQEVAHVV
jgi:hypothetical protein